MLSYLKIGQNFRGLPLFFQVFGIACSLMIIIAIYALAISLFREARIFFYTGLTGFLVLSLVVLSVSNRNLTESGLSQLFSLFSSFLLLPIFLAVPTLIILPSANFIDAYLDMVSVFTTTGLPVFENEFLTKPIHLWRALTAWFGGGLIWIAAFVILLPANFGGSEDISNKKGSALSNRKLTLNERSTTLAKVSQKLIPIYLSLTILLWCLLTAFGTDGYTSLIRALSVISTSGISGPEKLGLDGAGFFGELVIVLFLFIALSHNILKILIKQVRVKTIVSDVEVRLGLFIVLIMTVLLTFKQLSQGNYYIGLNDKYGDFIELIWGNFFTIFSFITTTGYVSAFWNIFSSANDISHTTIILIGLCLFGGGVATTAGGIKLLRISILFSAFSNETSKLLHPSSVTGANNQLKNLEISVFMAWIFFMLFIVSLAGLTIILAIFEMLFEDAIVLAVACLTTTGPIIEVIGLDKLLISDLSFVPKLTLAVGMVLGRLEILVVLSLLAFGFKRA